jgi:putative membrane protein
MAMQQGPSDTGDLQSEGTPAVATPVVDAKTGLASERTRLARFRTALAIDRTTLAWIRTALTSAAFGFGLIGVFRTIAPMAQSQEAKRLHEAAIYLAVAMVAIGMLGALLSAVSHWASLRKLHRGEELSAHRWPFAITAAAVVAMLGLYALWTVVTA